MSTALSFTTAGSTSAACLNTHDALRGTIPPLGSEAMRIKSSTQAGLRTVSLANALASVAGSPVRNRSSGKVIRSAVGSTP